MIVSWAAALWEIDVVAERFLGLPTMMIILLSISWLLGMLQTAITFFFFDYFFAIALIERNAIVLHGIAIRNTGAYNPNIPVLASTHTWHIIFSFMMINTPKFNHEPPVPRVRCVHDSSNTPDLDGSAIPRHSPIFLLFSHAHPHHHQ